MSATFAKIAAELGMTTPSAVAQEHIDSAHGYAKRAIRELRHAKTFAATGRSTPLAKRLEELIAEAEGLADQIHDLT
jgi:hypothetical protein